MEAARSVDAHVSTVQVVTRPFSPASCTPCLPPVQGIPISYGKPPGTGQGLDGGDPGAGGESLDLEETLGLEERPLAWRRDPGPGGEGTLLLRDHCPPSGPLSPSGIRVTAPKDYVVSPSEGS